MNTRTSSLPSARSLQLAAWCCLCAALLAPTLALSDITAIPASADTFIISTTGAADNNAGAVLGVTVGRDNALGTRRGLFQFDVSGIPAGSTVTSASLQLTVTMVPPVGVASSFDLHRLSSAWGEGNKLSPVTPNIGAAATAGEATWNSRLHGAALWTSPGALSDAAAVPSASTPVDAAANYTWSGAAVVADVQQWIDIPAQNFGWLLKSQNETSPMTVRAFGSRESLSAPVLTVGFDPPATTNTAPAVAITNPVNGASFAAPATVLIEAEVTDDGTVTGVEFFDGATTLGTDTTGPEYSVSAPLFPGGHLLTAVATDDGGLMSTSTVVSITVTNTVITNPLADRVPKGVLAIELETVADGMASPLGMGAPDDGSGRMFVYDQDGRVYIVTAAGLQPGLLLDIRSRLVTLGAYDERGLLGFAAHPDFVNHPLVYTYSSEPWIGSADFTNDLGAANNHQSVIAEWQIDAADSNKVDVSTRRELLRIDQPQSNHNGGAMRFGPDDSLYIVFGDGGNAHDVAPGHVPGGNGQASNNIWGSMIRIDVDGSNSVNGAYGIPAANPFVGGGAFDELYAYGLRNPFSFSFDRTSGDLLLGDVGQGKIEEVNVITAGGNYGWNVKEGIFLFDGAGNLVTAPVRPVPPGLIDPIAMYDHDDGLAIIGGYRYRGSVIGSLAGRYVFGDWGSFGAPSGRLFYLDDANLVTEFRLGPADRPLGRWIKGWGEDADGELYLFASKTLGPAGATGRMMKLVPVPEPVELTDVVLASGNDLTIQWTGGSGPYAVQHQNDMLDPLWQDAAIANATGQTVAASTPAGFFRTFDVAHTPSVPLSAWLAGDFEVPAVSTTGSGLGLFMLDGNSLTFSVSYAGLSGNATLAHIHGPAAPGASASPLINLQPYNGGAFGTRGTLSGVIVLTDAQKAHILSGRTYVNIHTLAHGGGEIRGQIVPVMMQADFSGANERPVPAVTPARGVGTMALVGNTLNLNVTYGGLLSPATASHIHGPASEDVGAGVLVNLSGNVDGAFGTSGSLSGPVILTPTQLRHVYSGLTYINVHSAAYSGGEIRGQILPKPSTVPLGISMSGLAVRPTPLVNSAAGSGTLMLDGDVLTFNVQYEGLSGPATLAHIHGPAAAAGPAGVLINLAPFAGAGFGASGTLSGSVVLTPPQRGYLLNAQTYINVHTALNPGGELRGQIVPMAMMVHLSGINERPAAVVTPGSGLGVLALVGNNLNMVVAYNDLITNASASHIHGPSSLFGTGAVLVNLSSLNGGGFGVSGSLSGAVSLTPDQLGFVVDGQTYINVHSPSNTSGEIRGQIQR